MGDYQEFLKKYEAYKANKKANVQPKVVQRESKSFEEFNDKFEAHKAERRQFYKEAAAEESEFQKQLTRAEQRASAPVIRAGIPEDSRGNIPQDPNLVQRALTQARHPITKPGQGETIPDTPPVIRTSTEKEQYLHEQTNRANVQKIRDELDRQEYMAKSGVVEPDPLVDPVSAMAGAGGAGLVMGKNLTALGRLAQAGLSAGSAGIGEAALSPIFATVEETEKIPSAAKIPLAVALGFLSAATIENKFEKAITKNLNIKPGTPAYSQVRDVIRADFDSRGAARLPLPIKKVSDEIHEDIAKSIETLKKKDILEGGYTKVVNDKDISTKNKVAGTKEVKQYNKRHLETIKGLLEAGETPGKNIQYGGEEIEKINVKSSMPDFFKNKGYSKKESIQAIDKALKGDYLGVRQAKILDDFTSATSRQAEETIDWYYKGVDDTFIHEGDIWKIKDFDTDTEKVMLERVTREKEGENEKVVDIFDTGFDMDEASTFKAIPLSEGKGQRIRDALSNEYGFINLPGLGRGIHKKVEGVKNWFDPFRSLPGRDLFENVRNKARGDIARVERITNKVFTDLEKYDEDTQVKIFDYLDGTIPDTALPQNARAIARRMRSLNNTIGKMLVKRKMLKQETYDAHKDKYVKYLYLKHVLGEKDFVGGAGMKQDLGWQMKRQDLTPDQKKAIGIIKRVSVAESTGVGTSLRDIALNDFYESIAKNPEWNWLGATAKFEGKRRDIKWLQDELEKQKSVVAAEPTNHLAVNRMIGLEQTIKDIESRSANFFARNKNRKDFKKMPVSRRYGKLSGAIVRKEIYDDIVPLYKASEPGEISPFIEKVLNIEEKVISLFKTSKVAINPPTMARNFISGMIQLNWSGIPMLQLGKYYKKAFGSYLRKDNTYQQLFRKGVFQGNFSNEEIKAAHDTLKKYKGFESSTSKLYQMIMELGQHYGKIDDIQKMVKFMYETEVNKMSPDKAIREANKWGMDYSVAPRSVKWLRRSVMPFSTYQYKIMPLAIEAAHKNPVAFWKWFTIPYMMQEAVKAMHGMTDKDFEKLEKDLPMFIRKSKTSLIMPFKSKDGNWQWVNAEYFFPVGNQLSIIRDLSEANFGGSLAQDLGLGNPLLDFFLTWKSANDERLEPAKHPFTRQDIYNAHDEPQVKAAKVMNFVYSTFAPSMLTSYGTAGKTYDALMGKTDRYGREATMTNAVLSALGVNVMSPDPRQARYERKALEKKSKQQMYRGIINNPDKRKYYIEQHKKKMKELYGR